MCGFRAAFGDPVYEQGQESRLSAANADVVMEHNTALTEVAVERRRRRRKGQICTFCCMALPPAGELAGVKRAFSRVLPNATGTKCRLCQGPIAFEESWAHHVSRADDPKCEAGSSCHVATKQQKLDAKQ